MNTRLNMAKADHEAYKAMMSLEKYVTSSQLTTVQKDLIKIRAS